MEPRQYNEKVYNKDVALLRNKIRALEEDILNGKMQVETLADFNRVLEEVIAIESEFSLIYEESLHQNYTLDLNTYFSYESRFLHEFVYFLKIFDNYHKAAGELLIDDATIKQEWKDIITIIRFNKTEMLLEKWGVFLYDKDCENEKEYLASFMKDLQVGLDVSEDNFQNKWQDMVLIEAFKKLDDEISKIDKVRNGDEYDRLVPLYNELNKEIDSKLLPRLKIIISNTNFGNKERYKGNIGAICQQISQKNCSATMESVNRILDAEENPAYYQRMRSKEFQEQRKKDVILDRNFMKQLTLSSQIKYIRLVLQNIISIELEDEEEVAHVFIDGKEYSYPKRYQYRVENYLVDLKQLERRQEKATILEESNSVSEEKATILEKSNSILEEKDQIIAERYAELQLEMDKIIASMRFLEEKGNSYLNKDKVVSGIVNGEKISVLKKDYEEYQTLFQKAKSIKATLIEIETKNHYYEDEKDLGSEKKQIEFWHRRKCEIQKGKKSAFLANAILLINRLNIPKKFQALYTTILYDTESFISSKKYTNSTKRKGLNNLCSLLNRLQDKNYRNEKFVEFVENSKLKMLSSLAMMPVKETETFVIRKVKKSSSKPWKKVVVVSALSSLIGLGALFALSNKKMDVKNFFVANQHSTLPSLETRIEENVVASKMEMLADKIIQYQKEHPDWEMTFEKEQNTPSIMSSVRTTVEQQETLDKVEGAEKVNMYDLVYLKPDSRVFATRGAMESEACSADITVPYQVTGVQYQNGAWISAESKEYDASSMCRACNAQENYSQVRVRLVNPTTGAYIGFVGLDSIVAQNELGKGR